MSETRGLRLTLWDIREIHLPALCSCCLRGDLEPSPKVNGIPELFPLCSPCASYRSARFRRGVLAAVLAIGALITWAAIAQLLLKWSLDSEDKAPLVGMIAIALTLGTFVGALLIRRPKAPGCSGLCARQSVKELDLRKLPDGRVQTSLNFMNPEYGAQVMRLNPGLASAS